MNALHPLERFWSLLIAKDIHAAGDLLEADPTWDDPLFDRATGAAVRDAAIPRLASWVAERALVTEPQHLRTTVSPRRIVVEDVLTLRDGLVWNQALQKSEKAARFELATALVADRTERTNRYSALRVYFSTWAVLDGASRVRVGPVAPDERAATKAAMDAMPTVRKYFDALAKGDASIIELFEPDGYFREPANNFACGRDQLAAHFVHILELGGVGIELLTSTREGDRIGLELQTVKWGTKTMSAPQAGFAAYELGPHGKLSGSRVYDSVVPPDFD